MIIINSIYAEFCDERGGSLVDESNPALQVMFICVLSLLALYKIRWFLACFWQTFGFKTTKRKTRKEDYQMN